MDESYHIDFDNFLLQLISRKNLNSFHFFFQNLLHCAWSPDGEMVSAGSADRFVYIWDTNTRKIMYKLPGHLGSVNDVDFHKVEPIGKGF